MGTRGTFGVRIGEDKLCYNHFDSYPDGLGNDIVTDIRAMMKAIGLNEIKKQAKKLKLIDRNTTPTQADIDALADFTDLTVSNQITSDWYCLTRKLQGSLANTLKAGVMLNASDFIRDSLMCEYGYIVNLDDETLECYRGFQSAKHTLGRYANAPKIDKNEKYYPCALVATYPLAKIPKNWAKYDQAEE